MSEPSDGDLDWFALPTPPERMEHCIPGAYHNLRQAGAGGLVKVVKCLVISVDENEGTVTYAPISAEYELPAPVYLH